MAKRSPKIHTHRPKVSGRKLTPRRTSATGRTPARAAGPSGNLNRGGSK